MPLKIKKVFVLNYNILLKLMHLIWKNCEWLHFLISCNPPQFVILLSHSDKIILGTLGFLWPSFFFTDISNFSQIKF